MAAAGAEPRVVVHLVGVAGWFILLWWLLF